MGGKSGLEERRAPTLLEECASAEGCGSRSEVVLGPDASLRTGQRRCGEGVCITAFNLHITPRFLSMALPFLSALACKNKLIKTAR